MELGTAVPEHLLASVEECVTPADPVVMVYTSGTTADPKGIVHTHGTVVRHSYNLTFSYLTKPGDVMFTSMPFFWIGGLITGLLAVVHHGATVVTQPTFDAPEALELIERYRATIAQGWPQQGKTLAADPSRPSRDLSSLRRTSMPDFVDPEQRVPEVSSMALGMTETCSCHTNHDPYDPLPESKRGTFGPSIEGLEHKIIDPDTGEQLPAGDEGEILVRGYALMHSRYKVERSEIVDADGWYHTGDAGHLDEEGWLFFTGRLGDMIKTTGGTNVTPAEVEVALAGIPGVMEAYVTGVTDPEGTAGTQIVAAALVARAGERVDVDGLRAALKGSLSAFKIPKHVWVCQKSELPFTDTGKLKKAELAKILATQLAP
jgi:acyl-CoA synthetase (AMP-forming)/AMP-acid ligase II